MATLHIKRQDVKREYDRLSMAMHSIQQLSESASRAGGLDGVTAVQAIKVICDQQVSCTPLLDEIFYPENESDNEKEITLASESVS